MRALSTLFPLWLVACAAPDVPVPVALPPPAPPTSAPMTGATAIAIGAGHGCAVVDGRVWCWGWPGPRAGDAPSDVARVVPGLSDVVALEAHGKQTCARTKGDALWCWGERVRPPDEARGLDPFAPELYPAPVRVEIAHVTRFGVGRGHACAIDDGDVLWCWGWDANGQVGAVADASTPHRVAADVASVDVGEIHTCWTTRAGALHCQGVPPPAAARGARVDQLNDATASMACSLTDGRVRCDAVGHWAPTDFAVPDAVDVTAFALGAAHGCILHADGSVGCWGQNVLGQLARPEGTGDKVGTIPGLAATAIGAGWRFTCALTQSGGVSCWGDNERGACGAPLSQRTVATPTAVRVELRP